MVERRLRKSYGCLGRDWSYGFMILHFFVGGNWLSHVRSGILRLLRTRILLWKCWPTDTFYSTWRKGSLHFASLRSRWQKNCQWVRWRWDCGGMGGVVGWCCPAVDGCEEIFPRQLSFLREGECGISLGYIASPPTYFLGGKHSSFSRYCGAFLWEYVSSSKYQVASIR